MYLNIQGYNTNGTQLTWIANQKKPVVMCLSETHITKDFNSNELNIDGYNSVVGISSSSHTGGTSIYIHKQYNYKEIIKLEKNKNMWLTGIQIIINKQKYYIYCLYHSPSASHAEFLEYFDGFLEDMEMDAVFVILGDFNIDMAIESCYSSKLSAILAKHGIYQLVNTFTRITKVSATRIDLLITNQRDIKFDVLLTPKITDHSIITANLGREKQRIVSKTYRSYNTMNTTQFQLALMSMSWASNSSTDVNYLADILTKNILNALNQYAPEKTVNIKESWGNKLWWNDQIKNETNIRDQYYQRAVFTKAEADWDKFKRQRNKVVTLLRNTKQNYYKEKIDETRDDPTRMWKSLKKLVCSKSYSDPKDKLWFNNKIVTGTNICEQFNLYFLDSIKTIAESIQTNKSHQEISNAININSNMEEFNRLQMSDLRKKLNKMNTKESSVDGITVKILKLAFETVGDKFLHVINCSLENGTFPTKWKRSMIVPIEKVTGTVKCEEFRPINMVPPYEKLLEICVNDQIVSYLEKNFIFSEFQSGFREKNSCESALQTVLFNWKGALEERKIIGVVFLDFKRAFETINRNLLLHKMKRYGFGEKILKWFKEYLADRTQVTKYGDMSDAQNSIHGVPQGTVLGPTLFILYMNDIVNAVKKCKIQMFADDTVIYVMGDRVDHIINTLNEELSNLFEWLNNNSMCLNVTKTKMMIIKNKNCKINTVITDVQINKSVIERVVQYKYLGCIIDENLTFSEHFKFVTNKIAKKTNVLNRISKNLSSWTRLTIYKSIIAPHLYFCSTLLFLMNNTDLDILQKRQNRALRIILGCNRYAHRIDMLQATNLLSVRQTIVYSSMIFVYKMLNSLLPNHLLKYCTFVRDIHEYDTRSRDNFYIARVSTSSSQNNLFYKGLRQYNNLPNNIRFAKDLNEFKHLCKSYVKQSIVI